MTTEPFLAFSLLTGSGLALDGELQEGPTGLVGGVIGRSLGSMNDVKDVVEDVLLLAGGLSAHGLLLRGLF